MFFSSFSLALFFWLVALFGGQPACAMYACLREYTNRQARRQAPAATNANLQNNPKTAYCCCSPANTKTIQSEITN